MLPFLFAALLQQQPQAPAAPVMHVVVSPANPAVMAGDSLRLTAEVRDSSGRVIPKATVRWMGGSFEGRVDTLGVVRGLAWLIHGLRRAQRWRCARSAYTDTGAHFGRACCAH